MGREPAIITLKDTWRTFSSSGAEPTHALAGVSLQVNRGDFIAIVGPSGSGKSTLLAVAGCLDYHTGGSCSFFGQSLSRNSVALRSKIRREHISYIFQNYKLLPHLSVIENVAHPLAIRGVPRRIRTKRSRDFLERVGLDDYAMRRPFELSGGQQQRVAVARALNTNPSVIIADEPTGALDSSNADRVVSLLEAAREMGVAVLMGTHDPRMSAHADQIIRMFDGKIIEAEENSDAHY